MNIVLALNLLEALNGPLLDEVEDHGDALGSPSMGRPRGPEEGQAEEGLGDEESKTGYGHHSYLLDLEQETPATALANFSWKIS